MPYIYIDESDISGNLDCVPLEDLRAEIRERKKRNSIEDAAEDDDPSKAPAPGSMRDALEQLTDFVRQSGLVPPLLLRELIHQRTGVIL